MENDKIENNHSFQKMKKELEGFEALGDFFSIIGLKQGFESAVNKNDFSKIKSDFEILTKSPDKFNYHFTKAGWIAHETMNNDLMLSCIELAENGKIEIAENELVNYYSTEKMQWLVTNTWGIQELYVRNDLINLAYEDTIAKRYHACIPVLLMIIDGVVNDIDKNKGFFTENISLTAWDSIAAHSSGLQKLKEIFNDTRKKTSTETITLPYRNGILHGRDLGYANQIVTAKCWAALFAIKDWAYAVREGKKNAPPPEAEMSIEENMEKLAETLIQFDEQHKRNKEIEEKITEWRPRTLSIGTDLPETGISSEYFDFTPEREAIKFIEYWKQNNYGNIARQIYQYDKKEINIGQEAAKVRRAFEGKKLTAYKILKIVDCAPAISEVTLGVDFIFDNNQYTKEITLRLIYQGKNAATLVFGEKGGKWKFNGSFFNKIEFL